MTHGGVAAGEGWLGMGWREGSGGGGEGRPYVALKVPRPGSTLGNGTGEPAGPGACGTSNGRLYILGAHQE